MACIEYKRKKYNLSEFKALLKSGEKNNILKEYSLYRGKWRYEIPDVELDMTKAEETGNLRLNDIIKPGSELIKAYPELGTNTVINFMPNTESLGEYVNPGDFYNDATEEFESNVGVINLDTSMLDNLPLLREVLVHEIQHAIQMKEGFARGGSYLTIATRVAQVQMKLDAIDKLKNIWDKTPSSNVEASQKAYNDYAEAMATIDWAEYTNLLQYMPKTFGRDNLSSEEGYMKLAGEVEARNVVNRLGLSAEDRGGIPLSYTEDVARNEQLKFFGSGIQRSLEIFSNDDISDFETGDNSPATVQKLQAKYPGVVVVKSQKELPLSIQEQAQANNLQVDGAFYKGTVYMVADNLRTMGKAEGTYRHERIGHQAVIQMMGYRLSDFASDLVNKADKVQRVQMEALSMHYFDNPISELTNDQIRELGEEYIALVAESRFKYSTTWGKIVAWVKNVLRDLGISVAVTDNDVQALLSRAEKFIAKGKIDGPQYARFSASFQQHMADMLKAAKADKAVREELPLKDRKYLNDFIAYVRKIKPDATVGDVIQELEKEKGVEFTEEEASSFYAFVKTNFAAESEIPVDNFEQVDQPDESTGNLKESEELKIIKMLARPIRSDEYPAYFEANEALRQQAAGTQEMGQGRDVADGSYIHASLEDLRQISIETSRMLKELLGSKWKEKMVDFFDRNPDVGNVAQVTGVLNVMSTEVFNELQSARGSVMISKLENVQAKIDKITYRVVRDASLALNQRRLYSAFATGRPVADIMSEIILSPEQRETVSSVEEALGKQFSDEELNVPKEPVQKQPAVSKKKYPPAKQEETKAEIIQKAKSARETIDDITGETKPVTLADLLEKARKAIEGFKC